MGRLAAATPVKELEADPGAELNFARIERGCQFAECRRAGTYPDQCSPIQDRVPYRNFDRAPDPGWVSTDRDMCPRGDIRQTDSHAQSARNSVQRPDQLLVL